MNADLPMVRVRYAWNIATPNGATYATPAEAREAEPYATDMGIALIALYIAADGRIIHTHVAEETP